MLKYFTHSHIKSIIMHSSGVMLCYVMFTLVSPTEGSFDDVARSEAAAFSVSMTAFTISQDPFDYRLVKTKIQQSSFSPPVKLLAAHSKFESFFLIP